MLMSSQPEEQGTVCDISLFFFFRRLRYVQKDTRIRAIRLLFSQFSNDIASHTLRLIVYNWCSSLTFCTKWCTVRQIGTPAGLYCIVNVCEFLSGIHVHICLKHRHIRF